MQTFGEMPGDPEPTDARAEAKNLIMHAELRVSGSTLMFSDTFPGMPLSVGDNISLTVVTTDQGRDRQRVQHAEGRRPCQHGSSRDFWSKLNGMVTDKFGVPWQVSLDSGEMSR